MTAGGRTASARWRTSPQIVWKDVRSSTRSCSGRPSVAVRMMTPPVKPCFSRKVRTMPRRRERSSRDSILRETPMWSTVGMNTRKRPAMVTWQVMRAPLVPSGSFATWTMTSCPSRRRSSIFASLARTRSSPSSPSSSSSPDSRRSNSSMVLTTSET